MGHELVTAIMPGFLVSLGAPAIALGLIEGVSAAGSLLAKPLGARMALSRWRRAWLGLGYLATTLKALMALVGSWPWMIPIRTLAWIGRGFRGPLRDTLIAEATPPEAYGRAYGFREAMDTVGALIGPLLGLWLLPRFGFRGLFLLSALPGLLSVVAVLLAVQGRRPEQAGVPAAGSMPPSAGSPEMKRSTRAARPTGEAGAGFRRWLLAAGLFAMAQIAPTWFILDATERLAAHPGAIGAAALAVGLYSLHNLVYALSSFPAGVLADRIGARGAILLGQALFVLALAGFASGPRSLVLFVPLFVLTGAATGLWESQQPTLLSRMLPGGRRAEGLAWSATVTGAGTLASGLVIGLLWTRLSAEVAFAAAALVALAALVLTTRVPAGRAAAEAG